MQLRDKRLYHARGKLIRGDDLFAADTGLAVDAYAVFHLIVRNFKGRRTLGGHGAGGEGKAERLDARDGLFRNGLDLGKRLSLLSRSARQFVDKERACNAAAADGIETVLDSDVVVDLDIVDRDAVLLRKRHRVFEVHDVAGVVLHDQQHALRVRGRANGAVDLDLGRGGKDVAADGSVQHARSDEARVRGFMAAAAAADENDLVLGGSCAGNDLILGVPSKRRICQRKTVTHLGDNMVCSVDDFLHSSKPPYKILSAARGTVSWLSESLTMHSAISHEKHTLECDISQEKLQEYEKNLTIRKK